MSPQRGSFRSRGYASDGFSVVLTSRSLRSRESAVFQMTACCLLGRASRSWLSSCCALGPSSTLTREPRSMIARSNSGRVWGILGGTGLRVSLVLAVALGFCFISPTLLPKVTGRLSFELTACLLFWHTFGQ
jgi:hypothetical protein